MQIGHTPSRDLIANRLPMAQVSAVDAFRQSFARQPQPASVEPRNGRTLRLVETQAQQLAHGLVGHGLPGKGGGVQQTHSLVERRGCSRNLKGSLAQMGQAAKIGPQPVADEIIQTVVQALSEQSTLSLPHRSGQ